MTDAPSRARSFAIVTVAYLLAGAAFWATVRFAPYENPVLLAGLGDLAATFVVFGFSVAFNNSSMYDPYWSVAPIPIVGWWWAVGEAGLGNGLRHGIILLLVLLWGLRLTYNWCRRWHGLVHEDFRYADYREKGGALAYWAISFSGFHLMPTVLVFAGCVGPAVALLAPASPLNALDLAAAAVAGAGILIEGISDNQLRRFLDSNPARGTFLQTGLWRYSRHPNYFGEILFWWGLGIFGFAAGGEYALYSLGGPLLMTGLFVFISIPMMDKRMRKRRENYEAYEARTSAVFLWPPKAA